MPDGLLGGNNMVFSGSFKKDDFQDVHGPHRESDSAPRILSSLIVIIHKTLFFFLTHRTMKRQAWHVF